jgi:lysozyme
MTTTPNFRMFVSEKGLDLIKFYESFEPNWYVCPSGKTTIGYGHVKLKKDVFSEPITEEFAVALLNQDCLIAENAVRERVSIPLTQGQFDALVSFAFNAGVGNFKASTLLRMLNAGDIQGAANQFDRWVFGTANGKKVRLNGLVKRRAEEKKLFLG